MSKPTASSSGSDAVDEDSKLCPKCNLVQPTSLFETLSKSRKANKYCRDCQPPSSRRVSRDLAPAPPSLRHRDRFGGAPDNIPDDFVDPPTGWDVSNISVRITELVTMVCARTALWVTMVCVRTAEWVTIQMGEDDAGDMMEMLQHEWQWYVLVLVAAVVMVLVWG
ncbi:uncharacterized protein MYCGRDRAFT_97665 [Zymoseptoria tritici IPO323]|uniref:Uncharacterized protein n=1 Tax=Zymoseptoria tritici (strain CBS 115943 / IPO323) TaxID=336722 RepID=F9XQX7_ZYMTI|nr:uncharacterized protein MYCGRDRAFT_97665 [Zymoseptoria tritici IPO323]EGP82309.1 hypothetical protein MYCGRDRAFT_97665 [Zymoseptoria tritici IPO323]